jgi:amicyanin
MKKNTGIIVVGLIILVLIIVGIVASQHKTTKTASTTTTTTTKADTSKAVATNTVMLSNYMFSPGAITVKAGATVTWTNMDAVTHTVTSDDSSAVSFKSDSLADGKSYSFTFAKAGTYTYHCTPHPYMHGTVVVTE